ncbi:DUF2293 domain-containing protein [uncultured Desulfosarcina sp.]|uniref:DUF2293 domain-containing protein n=1 Tax=uncultured Desulfosarcina sp. TaxID=218289 RepID=UPI0029C8DA7A|nr:DUF2293 domain-containing protein [uncultured Desulfosarcina sp.]
MKKKEELKVFISSSDSSCGECGENVGCGAWITLAEEKGALCLSCADLDHLVFLPSGDAALTRRARKYSTLAAVVLKWTRARKRYERQGLLVEVQALEQAEKDCLADFEVRERRRAREAIRREHLDRDYLNRFAMRVCELFPGCPAGRDAVIAEHACLKHSGRIGRSAWARRFDEGAVRLAVVAHIRHVETPYDELLMMGHDRGEARNIVTDKVDRILEQWAAPVTTGPMKPD